MAENSATEDRDTCLIVKYVYLRLATTVPSGIYTCEQGIIVIYV